jgi:hypothetical protein
LWIWIVILGWGVGAISLLIMMWLIHFDRE